MDDKIIIKLLKNERYSKLDFLHNEESLDNNENHLGFQYFLLDRKKCETSDTLNKIIKVKGSRSQAYYYLGEIANSIYSNFGEEHISLSFLWRSVQLDPNNAESWLLIFQKSRDEKALFNCLKIKKESKSYTEIKNILINFELSLYTISNLSKVECDFIISLINNKNIDVKDKCTNILISALYVTERYDDGVAIIKNSKKVNHENIENYYNKGLINKEIAISKISVHFLDRILSDSEVIYNEFLKEYRKDNNNITKSAVIKKAFIAEKYLDVINIFNESDDNTDTFFKMSNEPKLYYLLAQLFLKHDINKELLSIIHENNGIDDMSTIELREVFQFKYSLTKLHEKYTKEEYKHCRIYNISEYTKIEKIWENSDFINHFLYEKLIDELSKLKDLWNKSYFKYRLDSILNNKNDANFSDEDFIEICNLWIYNNNYDDVILKVEDYHKKNSPTITTSNLIGVCYERKGILEKALFHYETALNLMYKHSEFSYYIFSNYLLCSEKSSIKIPHNKYESIRNKLNETLVDSFKWHTFTAKRNKVLYKYYPFNLNTLDSLINQYFYLPSKSQLNDPIELPNLEGIGSDKQIDLNYRICSFSNNENSILMWSHYTDNHQGIMVEYFFGGELPCGVGIEKVTYTNENKRQREQNNYIFNQFLLTKNDEWSYEEEVRLITHKKDKVYYETYRYPEHDIFKINASVLSITLGCNFDESKKQLVINLIRATNDRRTIYESKVKLRQAKISERNIFGLEYVDIEV